MSAPISQKMRNSIIVNRKNGEKLKDIAKFLGISVRTVSKILKRYKEEGTLEPRPLNNGRKPIFGEDINQKILDKIKEKPDISLEELKNEFDLKISISGLCKKLKKLNLRYKKKTLFPKAQEREDVKKLREDWFEYMPFIDPKRLKFLDETMINLGMTRLYGRALGGERIVEYVPDVRFKRYSVLSTITIDGDMTPIVYSGTLCGKIFKLYIEQFIVPILKPFDILVMDCLSVHKVEGIAEMVEAVGANVVYLPPYSPDLNPIETVWSEVKATLKRLKARTFDTICDAVKIAVESVTPAQAKAHFANAFCGT